MHCQRISRKQHLLFDNKKFGCRCNVLEVIEKNVLWHKINKFTEEWPNFLKLEGFSMHSIWKK